MGTVTNVIHMTVTVGAQSNLNDVNDRVRAVTATSPESLTVRGSNSYVTTNYIREVVFAATGEQPDLLQVNATYFISPALPHGRLPKRGLG